MKDSIHPIYSMIRATMNPPEQKAEHDGEGSPRPFITIRSQLGAGGHLLASRLAPRLDALDPTAQKWQVFDRDLVERISRDDRIMRHVIEPLENQSHMWLKDLLCDIGLYDPKTDEAMLYQKVAATVASMAKVGHVVIVGRGGFLITESLPAGLHVQLVAPVDYRIEQVAQRQKLSREDAWEKVREIDANRMDFYRRHGYGRSLVPELFTLTMNSAQISLEQMVNLVLEIVPPGRREARPDLTTVAASTSGPAENVH